MRQTQETLVPLSGLREDFSAHNASVLHYGSAPTQRMIRENRKWQCFNSFLEISIFICIKFDRDQEAQLMSVSPNGACYDFCFFIIPSIFNF